MKFNLKNKPIFNDVFPMDGFQQATLLQKLSEWFDGFEKELRELQRKFRKEIYNDENYDGTTGIPIEDILGE